MHQPEPVELDVTGLQCPMPLLKAKRALNVMAPGERLRVLATDQGSVRDFRVFACWPQRRRRGVFTCTCWKKSDGTESVLCLKY